MYHGRPITPKKFNQRPGAPKQATAPMKWQNLEDAHCPNSTCEKSLFFNEDTSIFSCSCGFRISEARYKEITSNVAEKKGTPIRYGRDQATPEEQRQSELNDL